MNRITTVFTAVAVLATALSCAPAAEQTAAPEPLIVYSGRNESLVGPILERFTASTGAAVEVRYGDTSELTATLLEEGANTPADVFISQDAAALGALSDAGLLAGLPEGVLDRVPAANRSSEDLWVGVSGRARTMVYNPERIAREELPLRLEEVVEERFAGRYGVAPTNGSFQAHMAVYQVVEGAEALDALLAGMAANGAQRYPKNSAIVQATAAGEVDFGLVNHYYVWRALAEDPEAPVAVAYFSEGEASNFVNMAGAGVLSDRVEAVELVSYLLSDEAQAYFSSETFEYPLVASVEPAEGLTPLSQVPTPGVDFGTVAGALEDTLDRIAASGLID